jgi:hypothetical protein
MPRALARVSVVTAVTLSLAAVPPADVHAFTTKVELRAAATVPAGVIAAWLNAADRWFGGISKSRLGRGPTAPKWVNLPPVIDRGGGISRTGSCIDPLGCGS